ncbi:hypothetical protein M0812_04148 [Anaeramoeba flamelloides]|uniref:THH1/TOM1/TOM3 domain-containing protein n=1 Tax=Anaeramoeba flamelloides TaxID=1746091 RepID=A0AAV8AHB1_9EUKA|nr:hypothetical protein M0812_04148 [Anaeramoeba flamelloides]
MKFYLKGLVRTAPNTGSPWFYILGIFYFLMAVACFVDAFFNVRIYRYSTFVLFLTKIVFYTKDNAKRLNKVIQPIYGFSHLLLIIGGFIYPWYMTNHISKTNFHVGNYGVAMVLYFLLSIFSIGFALRVYWVIKNYHLNLNKKVKVKQTLFLISTISLLYFIQAIYGFFAIIGKNKIDGWANQKFLDRKQSYYVFIFFYLTITEISPILIIWVVFHISLKKTRQVIYTSIPSNRIQSKNEDEFHFDEESSYLEEED